MVMRVNPISKAKKAGKDPVPAEAYTRKAALILVFAGVYFFLIKILFL
jgi:hypothetical protein